MLTPWNGMDGAFRVHLCLYIQICTQGRCTDMPAYPHGLYVCTQTQSHKQTETHTQTPEYKYNTRERERERESRGDKRGDTGCSNPY